MPTMAAPHEHRDPGKLERRNFDASCSQTRALKVRLVAGGQIACANDSVRKGAEFGPWYLSSDVQPGHCSIDTSSKSSTPCLILVVEPSTIAVEI